MMMMMLSTVTVVIQAMSTGGGGLTFNNCQMTNQYLMFEVVSVNVTIRDGLLTGRRKGGFVCCNVNVSISAAADLPPIIIPMCILNEACSQHYFQKQLLDDFVIEVSDPKTNFSQTTNICQSMKMIQPPAYVVDTNSTDNNFYLKHNGQGLNSTIIHNSTTASIIGTTTTSSYEEEKGGEDGGDNTINYHQPNQPCFCIIRHHGLRFVWVLGVILTSLVGLVIATAIFLLIKFAQ